MECLRVFDMVWPKLERPRKELDRRMELGELNRRSPLDHQVDEILYELYDLSSLHWQVQR